MALLKKTWQKQSDRLKTLGIKTEDLEEKFILSSGPGGQKTNKTSSAVYLKHRPTGLETKATESRSRELNRYLARDKLIEAYQSQILGLKTKKEKLLAKQKKQKKRRYRRSKNKYDPPKNT
ncbi:MAG: peptide chain release factor-like protein [Parachlamydiales bacterium]|jgi:protein subunit release factor B